MRLIAAVLVALVPSLAVAADVTTNPHPGIKRVRRTTTTQNINVLIVDLCAPGVSVRATKPTENQRTVSSFGALVGAKAAVNGDFFNYATYSTTGPAMGDGTKWGGTDNNSLAPAQFGAHRVLLAGQSSTAGIEPWARQVVSGHPTLIANGTKRDNAGELCDAPNPRTALGLSKDGKQLILAVVDGRATGRAGHTCDQLATLMAEFGADDAVNLDGGGSSTMWLAGPGVINYPSDGTQRVVANHLAIRATGTGDAPNCPAPVLTANFVAAEAPLELTAGTESVVWLELENTGDTAWASTTRVGTQDPEDRDSVFVKPENWIAANRPTGVDAMTEPGATGRFTWAMVAPQVTETTTFEETFQLVEEGMTWFGPKHTFSITVHPTTGATDPDASGGCSTSGTAGTSWLALVALALLRRRRAT